MAPAVTASPPLGEHQIEHWVQHAALTFGVDHLEIASKQPKAGTRTAAGCH
jgi:hypothetical protein